jgi:putative FmdB family regulatory protein
MPIYEYACMECESHFDELVRSSEQAVTCPECGGGNVLKQLSTFAVHGSPKPSLASAPRASGGGCCGGSCGCGH